MKKWLARGLFSATAGEDVEAETAEEAAEIAQISASTPTNRFCPRCAFRVMARMFLLWHDLDREKKRT